MPAKKLKQRVAKAARGVARKAKATVAGVRQAILDDKAVAAANMLMDPCNAKLSEACYRGDVGYKSRFVNNQSLGTGAGQTAAAIAFIPSNNTYAFVASTSSGISSTWTVVGGPGTGFLGGAASSIRSLGACVSATPISANLNTSGQVYTTICPVNSLPSNAASGTAVTIDNLLLLCNKYGKLSIDEPMETKFIPAAGDENYSPITVAPPSDLSDNNCILMCFVGLPPASGVICRLTNIIEWKPQPFTGISSESYQGNPSVNTIEHVKQALVRKDANWWSNIGKGAYSVVRGYVTGGMVGAMGAAMKATKFF